MALLKKVLQYYQVLADTYGLQTRRMGILLQFQLRRAGAVNHASPNLDVLRSLAISFVVTSHLLLDRSLVNPGGYNTQTLGTLGVLIFFVHTCLVLMLSLDRQLKADRPRSLTVSFLVARAFRIYPLSIVVIVLLTVIERMHSAEPSLSTFLSNILLIQNITGSASITPVLWSLPFEFQMYFFLPMLYIWSQHTGRYSPGCIGAIWCASVALVLAFWRLGLDINLIRFFPCFLPGVLAFCRGRLPRTFPPAVLFAYVASVAIVYPSMVGRGVNATVLSWIICLGLGIIIPRCQEITSPAIRLIGSIVSRYSYGIYLVHDPIRHFTFHYLEGISSLASWSIYIVAVSGLSYIAYHLIEKPGIEFGRAIVHRMNVGRAQAGENL